MDKNIIGLIKADKVSKGRMHSYLISCYEKIVLPMSLQLKKIMIVF